MAATIESIQQQRADTTTRGGVSFERVADAVLPQIDNILRTTVVFNAFFLTLGVLEFILLVSFFTLLAQSAVLATSLALIFLTFFSYFTLKLYLQAKQPEQFREIKERYLNACKGLIGYSAGNPEHFVALANACTEFAERLNQKRELSYELPNWMEFVIPLLHKFSAWCQGEDVLRMQEILLNNAVEENIRLVKRAPTSLAAHASLANAYMSLAALYSLKKEQETEDSAIPEDQEKKFRVAAERAIVEYKIISDLSPDDPWAHAQLASIYHDLKMPHEAIREFETILRLTPEENDALFKLGKLYFQQGWNGHGLRIYEQLKQKADPRSAELIEFYGQVES